MKSPYEVFKTDTDLEKAGIWLDYGDFKIRIARAGGSNSAYSTMLTKVMRPIQRRLDLNLVTDEEARKKLAVVFARTVLLTWEDVADEDGEEMEFSVDNAVKLLTDLPDLLTDIMSQATQSILFRPFEEEAEDISGN